MFDVFGVVKGFIKLDNVCIDNNVFRLHYKVKLKLIKPHVVNIFERPLTLSSSLPVLWSQLNNTLVIPLTVLWKRFLKLSWTHTVGYTQHLGEEDFKNVQIKI